MIPRIYADFNNQNKSRAIGLNTVGSLASIAEIAGNLGEGMIVVLYDDDLEVQARLKRSPDGKHWLGIPDWSSRRFLK
jgi:hypothetical protein